MMRRLSGKQLKPFRCESTIEERQVHERLQILGEERIRNENEFEHAGGAGEEDETVFPLDQVRTGECDSTGGGAQANAAYNNDQMSPRRQAPLTRCKWWQRSQGCRNESRCNYNHGVIMTTNEESPNGRGRGQRRTAAHTPENTTNVREKGEGRESNNSKQMVNKSQKGKRETNRERDECEAWRTSATCVYGDGCFFRHGEENNGTGKGKNGGGATEGKQWIDNYESPPPPPTRPPRAEDLRIIPPPPPPYRQTFATWERRNRDTTPVEIRELPQEPTNRQTFATWRTRNNITTPARNFELHQGRTNRMTRNDLPYGKCWLWIMYGSCKWGNGCRYVHDNDPGNAELQSRNGGGATVEQPGRGSENVRETTGKGSGSPPRDMTSDFRQGVLQTGAYSTAEMRAINYTLLVPIGKRANKASLSKGQGKNPSPSGKNPTDDFVQRLRTFPEWYPILDEDSTQSGNRSNPYFNRLTRTQIEQRETNRSHYRSTHIEPLQEHPYRTERDKTIPGMWALRNSEARNWSGVYTRNGRTMDSEDIARELWAHERYDDGRTCLDEALREYTAIIRHRERHGHDLHLNLQTEMVEKRKTIANHLVRMLRQGIIRMKTERKEPSLNDKLWRLLGEKFPPDVTDMIRCAAAPSYRFILTIDGCFPRSSIPFFCEFYGPIIQDDPDLNRSHELSIIREYQQNNNYWRWPPNTGHDEPNMATLPYLDDVIWRRTDIHDGNIGEGDTERWQYEFRDSGTSNSSIATDTWWQGVDRIHLMLEEGEEEEQAVDDDYDDDPDDPPDNDGNDAVAPNKVERNDGSAAITNRQQQNEENRHEL